MGTVKPDGTTFETEATNLQLAFTRVSADGDVLDRETRTIDASAMFGGALVFATPVVYRAGTVAQVRAMQESASGGADSRRPRIRADRSSLRARLARRRLVIDGRSDRAGCWTGVVRCSSACL